MRAIRRFYFYLVAFISLEVVLWGVISLARTLFNGNLAFSSGETLAGALALLLVGTPIFLVHWFWAQRAAAQDVEEKTASLRAVFFYAALLATLIPVIQNLLALINRLALQSASLGRDYAILGSAQTLTDNLLAIFFNLLLGGYFWNILRSEWTRLPEKQNFGDARRLYRYLWLVYSLLMLIFGVEKILHFLLILPINLLNAERPDLINGLALTLVGAPLWAVSWQNCQRAREEAAEQGSGLRLGALFLLTLAGTGVSLSAAGNILYQILRALLVGASAFSDVLRAVSGPLALALPFGAVWAYYGQWFNAENATAAWAARRAGIQRGYAYLLAAAGLAATVTGLIMLLSFWVNLVLTNISWGSAPGEAFANALATLAIGLPLWLKTWRPLQAEALAESEAGEAARNSLIRRFYLYATLFASVIGGMVLAIMLAYFLLNTLLSGEMPFNFWADTLNQVQILALFITLLLYHSLSLRRDGARSGQQLAARRKAFNTLVISGGQTDFGARLANALQRQSADLTLTLLGAEENLPQDSARFGAVALPAELALDPSPALKDWLAAYPGPRLIVPPLGGNWLWAGDFPRQAERNAAQILCQLADGESVRPAAAGNSAWTAVIYLFAALFGLQILFGALMLIISLLTGF